MKTYINASFKCQPTEGDNIVLNPPKLLQLVHKQPASVNLSDYEIMIVRRYGQTPKWSTARQGGEDVREREEVDCEEHIVEQTGVAGLLATEKLPQAAPRQR